MMVWVGARASGAPEGSGSRGELRAAGVVHGAGGGEHHFVSGADEAADRAAEEVGAGAAAGAAGAGVADGRGAATALALAGVGVHGRAGGVDQALPVRWTLITAPGASDTSPLPGDRITPSAPGFLTVTDGLNAGFSHARAHARS